MTIKSYYKHFLSLYGALATAIAGLPFLSKLLPEDWAQYAFPPLGMLDAVARATVLIMAGGVTLIVYFGKDYSYAHSKLGRLKVGWPVFSVAMIALIILFVLTQGFVRIISIPSAKKSVVVSVGYERTDFAQSTFRNKSDEEMLRARGVTEEEIRRLWTPLSITVIRLGLYLSYLMFILSVVALISLAVLFDKIGMPTNP